jgi:ABC-type uncharacterized transport system substrate-binding protein
MVIGGRKTLQALEEAAANVERVAALWNPTFTLPAYYKEMEKAARAFGMTLLSFECRSANDFDPALRRITAGCLFVDGRAVPVRPTAFN